MTIPKIIGVIPARSGSKRIPNKNIKLLGNYPLISYSIIASKLIKLIDMTVVTTDSMEIGAISSIYGADEVVIRPPELSTDTSPDRGWAIHFLEWFKQRYEQYPEQIVLLRPTTPFRDPRVIEMGILTLLPKSSSLRSVEPLKEALEKTFRVENGDLVGAYPFYEGMKMIYKTEELYNLPNQTFPTSYMSNGYVDILKTGTLLNTNTLGGFNMQAFITERVIDIDTIDDFEYAEYILNTKGHQLFEFLRKKDYLYFKH